MAVLDTQPEPVQRDARWRDRRINEPTVPIQHPSRRGDARTDARGEARAEARVESEEMSLVELHQSIASLLASRGEWRQAYEHLRHALDLATAERPPQVPEQFRQEVARLRREHAEAREQSIRDALTASYNRR